MSLGKRARVWHVTANRGPIFWLTNAEILRTWCLLLSNLLGVFEECLAIGNLWDADIILAGTDLYSGS